VDRHAVLEVPPHRARQHEALQVLALAHLRARLGWGLGVRLGSRGRGFGGRWTCGAVSKAATARGGRRSGAPCQPVSRGG
jgi:hypothetical protein